jgi:GntR family transcriptional regulator
MSLPDRDGDRPLYAQVRERLIERIRSGEWKPGQLIANEFEIAAEFGVSQGTARKAIGDLASEGLVVRRQGRGTFVASHDEERILFQFFRMVSDGGVRRFPESRTISVSIAKADELASKRLGIGLKESVVAIERVRSLDGRPCIHEKIVLPRALFPRIERIKDLPNNLYALYSVKYGVTIARGSESLKAVAADARQVELLETGMGEPILLIDRVALGVDGTRAEWRRSLCRTDQSHYLSDLK